MIRFVSKFWPKKSSGFEFLFFISPPFSNFLTKRSYIQYNTYVHTQVLRFVFELLRLVFPRSSGAFRIATSFGTNPVCHATTPRRLSFHPSHGPLSHQRGLSRNVPIFAPKFCAPFQVSEDRSLCALSGEHEREGVARRDTEPHQDALRREDGDCDSCGGERGGSSSRAQELERRAREGT